MSMVLEQLSTRSEKSKIIHAVWVTGIALLALICQSHQLCEAEVGIACCVIRKWTNMGDANAKLCCYLKL